MNRLALSAAAVAATPIASSASAAVLMTCSTNDIKPTAQACVGFKAGNLLNNANLDAQTDALDLLGLTWTGATVEKLSGLSGAKTVNFTTQLKGISYIGVHYGNGQGGPGNGTAFYRIDAGAGLSSITLNYSASSNLVVFATNTGAPVPEPATWAMMVLGFGLAGYAVRRAGRATKVVRTA